MEQYKFNSTKMNFNGMNGYMVKQLEGNKVVCEQFIRDEFYEGFCNAIGCVPEENEPDN